MKQLLNLLRTNNLVPRAPLTVVKNEATGEHVFYLYDVIYDGSKYVAAGKIGGDGAIWTSTDLSNWTLASLSARTSYFYATAAGNGKYVAVGANTNSNSVSALATSSDGFNWTAVNTQTGVMRDVAFGSGLFVAVGTDSSKAALRTSTDGVTWTVPTLPEKPPSA